MKMLDAKIYRQYAADCVRIAEKMGAKDRKVLLEIAQAWDMRAEEAERREVKPDGKALKCVECKRCYPIRDDIPVMLIDEATIEE